MRFFFSLRAVLGWSARGGRLAEELGRRGATRELTRYLEPFGDDAAGAWMACPRGSWCLELAARVDIEPGVLHAATRALFEDVPFRDSEPVDPREWGVVPAEGAAGASSAVLVATQRALMRFEQGGDVNAFVLAAESLCFELVDAQPAVREARADVEEAQRWGRFREVLAASERYDEAYAGAHFELADRVRRHVPTQLVRRALGAFSAHPYR